MPDQRRHVPSTAAVLADPRLAAAADSLGPDIVKRSVHRAQNRARDGLIATEAVADTAVSLLPESASSLRRVYNATGVVLHTNLGRAPLSPAAVAAVELASGYTDVEFDLDTGRRARRGLGAVAALVEKVPRAEAAHIVNNGAAALLLAAVTHASGREIVISRGELVEIGDGFRIPDLLRSTGVTLREVGSTNRTGVRDYADAVGPDTAFILKVHQSNFRIEGFTSAVRIRDLVPLGVPVLGDLGSGLLAADPSLPDEPDAASWLAEGAAMVTTSGDKLLGGPQAGIVLGARAMVEPMTRHPMARALRVDKLTLAALEATVRGPATPTHDALHTSARALKTRSTSLVSALRNAGVAAELVPARAVVGGGSAPGVTLDGWAVRLNEHLAEPLRRSRPSVVCRVDDGHCLLDLRCVPADADDLVARAVMTAGQCRVAGDTSCT